MPNNNPIVIIIRSTVRFAFYGLLVLLALATIIMLPCGGLVFLLSSPGFVVFYFLPTVLLIGAIWGFVSLFPWKLGVKIKKRSPISWYPSNIVFIILLFALLIGLVAIPHLTIRDKAYVDRAARWYYVDPADEDLPWSKGERKAGAQGRECDTQLVLLVIEEEFTETLFICNQAVVDYLNTLEDNHVSMTYELTYNFGDFRWDLPFSLGPVSLDYTGWRGGEGCGSIYNDPCDSQYAGILFLQERT